eukprot:m.66374 g.66374  ORF g.66374 m.66374 type:complete len:1116 (+) comp12114_c0_seq1:279-3626(+)
MAELPKTQVRSQGTGRDARRGAHQNVSGAQGQRGGQVQGATTPRRGSQQPDSPTGRGNTSARASGTPRRRRIKCAPPHISAARRDGIRRHSCNLAAALNDPRQPKQTTILTRDWGEAFIAPDARSLQTQAQARAHNSTERKQVERMKRRYEAIRWKRLNETAAGTPSSSRSGSVFGAALDVAAVPDVFTNPDFNLKDASHFSQVMAVPAEQSLKPSAMLRQHDQLGHLLDIVEVNLSVELAKRSDRIFRAMSSHEVLATRVVAASKSAQKLRYALDRTKQGLINDKLGGVRLLVQRRNHVKVLAYLETVHAVSRAQATVQLLLASQDYIGALTVIETTQDIIQAELLGVQAIRHLATQLDEIRKVVGSLVRDELIRSLMQGLDEDTTLGFETSDSLKDGSNADVKTVDEVQQTNQDGAVEQEASSERFDRMAEQLMPIVAALVKEYQTSALVDYSKAVLTHLRTAVKDLVVRQLRLQSQADGGAMAAFDDPSQIASWADSLRTLNFVEWQSLLELTFATMTTTLQTLASNKRCLDLLFRRLMHPSRFPSKPGSETSLKHMPSANLIDPRSNSLASLDEELDGIEAHHLDELQASSSDTVLSSIGSGCTVEPQGIRSILESHSPEIPFTVDASPRSRAGSALAGTLPSDGEDDEFESEVMYNATDAAAMSVESMQGIDLAPAVAYSPSPMHPRSSSARGSTPTSPVKLADLGRISPGGSNTSLLEQKAYNELCTLNATVLADAVDEVHQRCSKLIQARSRDGADASMGLQLFVNYYSAVASFITTTTHLCHHHPSSLKSTLLSQAKTFLKTFHSTRMEKLQMMLTNEHWAQTHVPVECQRVVNKLIGMEQDSQTRTPDTPQTADRLIVGDGSFAVVGIVLLFIPTLSEYCECLEAIPSISTDVLRALLDVVRYFNVQTCKLILYADALRVVRLKRITAKHLALSSQCLSALINLLPHLRDRCAKAVPDRAQMFMTEFSNIQRDLTKHRTDIYDKMVAIMEEVWRAALPTMNWHKALVTEGCKSVAQSAKKLHKALHGILQPDVVTLVFSRVFVMINNQIALECKKLSPDKDKPALVGLAADVVHLETKLAELADVDVRDLRSGLSSLGLVLPGNAS